MVNDDELLRRFVAEGAQEAFAEFVRRHIGFVYGVALRRLAGNTQGAEDVAQDVFTAAARQAAMLRRHPAVSAWLFRSTRFAAAEASRAEQRRRRREQAAFLMHDLTSDPASAAEWERVRPVLDDVLEELPERDRSAVLLRFHEARPFAEIGARLAISEDAARMRVERALAKLQARLARRGITSPAAALAIALGGQTAGLAVPASLATSVAAASLAGAGAGTVAGGGLAVAGLLGFMSTTKIMTGAAVVAAGLAFLAYRDADRTRKDATQQESEWRGKVRAAELRAEVQAQRAGAADADNAQLLDALGASRRAETAARVPSDAAEWLAADRFANRGRGTPAAALETFYWATSHNEVEAAAAALLLTPDGRSEAEKLLSKVPADRSKFGTVELFAASLLCGAEGTAMEALRLVKEESGATSYPSGYRIEEVYRLPAGASDDPGYRTLFTQARLRSGKISEPVSLYRQLPDGWRMVLPPGMLSALWQARARKSDSAGSPPAAGAK